MIQFFVNPVFPTCMPVNQRETFCILFKGKHLTFCTLSCLSELFQDPPNSFSHPHCSRTSTPFKAIWSSSLFSPRFLHRSLPSCWENSRHQLLSFASSFCDNLTSFILIPKQQTFKNDKDSTFFFSLKLILSIYKCSYPGVPSQGSIWYVNSLSKRAAGKIRQLQCIGFVLQSYSLQKRI